MKSEGCRFPRPPPQLAAAFERRWVSSTLRSSRLLHHQAHYSCAPTVTEHRGAMHPSSFKTAIMKIREILQTYNTHGRLAMQWPGSQGVWAQTAFMELENFMQGFRSP